MVPPRWFYLSKLLDLLYHFLIELEPFDLYFRLFILGGGIHWERKCIAQYCKFYSQVARYIVKYN